MLCSTLEHKKCQQIILEGLIVVHRFENTEYKDILVTINEYFTAICLDKNDFRKYCNH